MSNQIINDLLQGGGLKPTDKVTKLMRMTVFGERIITRIHTYMYIGRHKYSYRMHKAKNSIKCSVVTY